MTDTPDLKATLSVLMLAVVVVLGTMSGATAPVGAAQPSLDTSTTDQTTTTTDVQGGDTIGANNTFEGNSSNETTVQYVADSNNTKVAIEGPNGVQVYANTSANQVSWNATQGDGNFNVTVNHGALDDLERGINQNVTTTWFVTNNTTVSSPDTMNFTVHIESDDSKSVEVVSDADVDAGDIVTVEESSYSIAGRNITAGPLWADKSTIETNERSVNGSTTDVVVVLGNTTVAEDFTSVASEASAGASLSSLTSLNRNVLLLTNGDGEQSAVPVYADEAPDSVDSSSTYAVQKTVGGQESLVVNLGDSYEDASSVSVTAVGGAGLFTNMDEYLTASVSNLMPAFINMIPSGFGSGAVGMITASAWLPAASVRRGGA